jgi:hypothetical protein
LKSEAITAFQRKLEEGNSSPRPPKKAAPILGKYLAPSPGRFRFKLMKDDCEKIKTHTSQTKAAQVAAAFQHKLDEGNSSPPLLAIRHPAAEALVQEGLNF